MSAASERAEELLTYASSKPDGFTKTMACAALGWGPNEFGSAVNALRRVMSDDQINLVCTPAGRREQWVYELVGMVDGVSRWTRNRILDSEARLETIGNVANSMVNATTARSVDGRRARVIADAIRDLRRELSEIA